MCHPVHAQSVRQRLYSTTDQHEIPGRGHRAVGHGEGGLQLLMSLTATDVIMHLQRSLNGSANFSAFCIASAYRIELEA